MPSGKRSSARRNERRAQLYAAQQQRKRERTAANKAAAARNKALKAEGKPCPTDKWVDVKERAAEARQRRSQERQASTWRQRVGRVRTDKRPPGLVKAWREFTAGRQDAFS